jgi:hypothetical protein
MAAAAVGALISGIAVYAVGARAAQDPFTQMPAYVQTVDGRYIQVPDARTVGFPGAVAPIGFAPTPGYVTAPGYVTQPGYVTTQPMAAPRVVVQEAPAPARVYRTAAPASQRVVVRETEDAQPQRSWTKTAMIVGGSAASGAGVGGLVGGKKGALVGAAIGGGAASIYEAAKRR